MSVEKYNKQVYWDSRYKTEDTFEWFGKGYHDFRNILQPYLQKCYKILVLGCGNSPFSYDMYEDGYTQITNIDYSPICIEMMAEKYKNCEEMKWVEMNIKDLHFAPKSFDAVIEKGTIDALLVEEKDPWNVSDEGRLSVEKCLNQVTKVLKSNGRFISISFSQPHFRKQLYCCSQYEWDFNLKTMQIKDCFEYFVYVMTKGLSLSNADMQYEKMVANGRMSNANLMEKQKFLENDNENFLWDISL